MFFFDYLSVNLNTCQTGRIVGYTNVSHFMYADVIVLLCGSAIDLSYLMH